MGDGERLSRRDLFLGALGRGRTARRAEQSPSASGAHRQADVAPPPPSPRSRGFALPIHRPPGAVDEASFLLHCTRCNACVEACPPGAITLAPSRFRGAAGTPMIDPHTAACAMCHDTPCITACEPRVLRPEQPRKMGVAWIQPMACLAHTGSFCTTCSERCPVPGAIEVKAGKPTIDPDICTGCGTCAWVCPAPTNAVVVMPLADRPLPPPSRAQDHGEAGAT